jgi:hypothetical protein
LESLYKSGTYFSVEHHIKTGDAIGGGHNRNDHGSQESDQNSRQQAVTNMAKLIEYYIPSTHKKRTRWVPQSLRGKVIDFPTDLKKSA